MLPHAATALVGLVLGAGFLLACAADAAPAITLTPRPAATRPAVHQRLEWDVTLDRSYTDPFDPDQIAIDATFAAPGGQKLTLPAFWMQDFERREANGRDRLVSTGQPTFRIRFTPTQPGQWSLQVTARDATGASTSAPLSFDVAPSTHPGFVRRAPGNSRYFQLDSGQPYFIIGPNICWAGRAGLPQFQDWFSHLSQAGGNFTRVWMSSPNRPTETTKAGLGRYDLEACAFYDQILELADANNLKVMLALGTYGDYREGGHFGEGKWPISPYNAANGGPAAHPQDFFTNPTARQFYRRRLRYLIGRYASYTSLGFWEFWNEQDNSPGVKVPLDWTREMAGYLKAHDPYQRLVTTSFAGTPDPGTWRLPEIDLSQRHIYGDHESPASMYEREPAIISAIRAADEHKKPHLIGEIGICWRDPDTHHDPTFEGTNLHNALWASALSGAAGSACNWWWDSYIAPHNLWNRYTGLARFSASIDWPRRQFKPLTVPSPVFSNQAQETFGDVTLVASLPWGKGHGKRIVLARDGTASAAIPTFLYGPVKTSLKTPTSFDVDLPHPSRLTVRLAKVSDHANLRITIDGKVAGEFAFRAPAPARDQPGEKRENGSHQAAIDQDRSVDLPAGPHTIALDVTEGDWLSLASITFARARSSRYTGLRVMALADARTGETIAWLHDPQSTSGLDAAHTPPRRFENALLLLPVARPGAYQVQWWDTRKGEIISTRQSEGPTLSLAIPSFTRDIALRAVPRDR